MAVRLADLLSSGGVRLNRELINQLEKVLQQKTVRVSRLKKIVYPLLNEYSLSERQNKKKTTRINKLLEERKQLHRKIRNQKEALRR